MYRISLQIFLALSLSLVLVAEPGALARGPVAQATTSITIDGGQQFQRIDGFGVNANSASWDGGGLTPALDLLADTMRVRIWRVIVEEADWEKTNDNDDPNSFHWDYYNRVYESGEFPGLWDMIAYLNKKGANRVMLNVMGRVPDWMGRTEVKPEYEDEWVEMIASMVYYGRNTRKLDFTLFSPTNEVDIGAPEGPRLDPGQYARLIKKLIIRLDGLGLGDIRIVPPDIAIVQQAANYLPPLFADATIMAKVDHFSFHDYGGTVGDVDRLIKDSAYPDRTFWITEFSAGCPGCDMGLRTPDPWNFGFLTADLLMRYIEQGASSAMIYEAYDSYYDHHGSFGYWGMLAYDDATRRYTPTKRFYLNAQIFRFTQPGMVRINVTNANSNLQLLAFKDPATGTWTLVGRNAGNETVTLNGKLANLPTSGVLELYQTTQSVNLERKADVPVTNNSFTAQIEPLSVFTLTNLAPGQGADTQPPTVSLTAPANDATVSGRSVVVAASANDNVAVTSVQFLLDGAPLGTPVTSAPYRITWDTTTVAEGSHALGAQARDAAGNIGLAATVRVTVDRQPDNGPPNRVLLPVTVKEREQRVQYIYRGRKIWMQ